MKDAVIFGTEPVPQAIQDLANKAQESGWGDFWFHPEAGLYGTDPTHTDIEDERVPITPQLLKEQP